MAYKKLMADDKIIVAFCDRRKRFDDEDPVQLYPQYIDRILNKKLSGVRVESATGEEFKKYKRTRKNKQAPPVQLNILEVW